MNEDNEELMRVVKSILHERKLLVVNRRLIEKAQKTLNVLGTANMLSRGDLIITKEGNYLKIRWLDEVVLVVLCGNGTYDILSFRPDEDWMTLVDELSVQAEEILDRKAAMARRTELQNLMRRWNITEEEIREAMKK